MSRSAPEPPAVRPSRRRGCCGSWCSSRCRCTTWAEISLKTGTLETGYQFTWHFQTYADAISNYQDQLLRSFWYAGLSTLIALLIALPLAYVIAFRAGKYKNALLLLVILPFFITYLVRTLSWQTILDDDGWSWTS